MSFRRLKKQKEENIKNQQAAFGFMPNTEPDDIANAYIKSTNYINEQIEKVFRNFQLKNGLTEDEAKKLLKDLLDNATIAVFDDDIKPKLKRRAKNPETGEDMLVPADMTYAERKEKYAHIEAERYTREDYKYIEKTKVSWHLINSEKMERKY